MADPVPPKPPVPPVPDADPFADVASWWGGKRAEQMRRCGQVANPDAVPQQRVALTDFHPWSRLDGTH